MSTSVIEVVHGRARLAVHTLRAEGTGTPAATHPLLLLHGLGEASPRRVPDHLTAWPGPVHALDFTGHGASTRPAGGGYTAEVLMGDVDAALDGIGPATVLGRGLGAYVALLVAGARPDAVRGAILTDGPGLVGGGIRPTSPFVLAPPAGPSVPDPLALFELSHDVRPPDYAVEYLRLVTSGSDLPQPLAVCTIVRPPWLDAVIAEGGERVAQVSLPDALAAYAGV
jgi:pimeloyl-ACP methyl ester carboxylesterase